MSGQSQSDVRCSKSAGNAVCVHGLCCPLVAPLYTVLRLHSDEWFIFFLIPTLGIIRNTCYPLSIIFIHISSFFTLSWKKNVYIIVSAMLTWFVRWPAHMGIYGGLPAFVLCPKKGCGPKRPCGGSISHMKSQRIPLCWKVGPMHQTFCIIWVSVLWLLGPELRRQWIQFLSFIIFKVPTEALLVK